MTDAFTKAQTPTQITKHFAALIGIKLDGTNYALWSQVVEMYIFGKDNLGYINGDFLEPSSMSASFRKWHIDNAIVKGWLINSIDPSLIGNFIRFPMAKQVWDSIAITYFDGSDTSQVYDLRRCVSRLRQVGGSLKKYYNDLQGLWHEIDFCRPNPMECPTDIKNNNHLLQEDRVYTFLDGLDDQLDKIRGDMLQMRPFPTIEQAYAHVRREAIWKTVMITGGTNDNSRAVLASKGFKAGKVASSSTGFLSLGSGKFGVSSKPQKLHDGTKCTHCGNMKHTHETCFKLHGYPDWWNELRARKRLDATRTDGETGKATLAIVKSSLSLTSLIESS